ncbi:hypothetical protein GO755_26015 [Spirosoma sp. HMF4905]|uniref:Peptidase M56 domain-containing protein n=1 Tax=Spirosoma arboris TaxID=2682092 RepID=A0A7K1SI78_9BACT|nr:M56 family metallopeptidase [Spirosoma arboris]MVM33520.1 hypothetical protein [Spirosoma arboris]
MEAPFLTHWISGALLNAICWTLIHSLWIGFLIAVLTGGVIIGTQKASSRLRYQLLCSCLLLFAGTMSFVFYQELTTYHSGQSANYTPTVLTPDFTAALAKDSSTGTITEDSPILSQLTAFINQQAGWIFAIWLLFFIIKSLKLISGLYYVHRIRYHKVHAPTDEWERKVLDFSRVLGIQQTITLVQSELVNIPVTVGVLKPVILLPMGLLFQLPPEQIDTILWHELAHIWRRDYLINLLQSLVEIVFFFNPGLLWLSALIREEREVCCDDVVLAHTAQKTNYLEALFAFQTYSAQPAGYTMALGFGNQQLMNRLKRMVSQENKRLSVVEKIVLLSGLLLLSAFAFTPTVTPPITQQVVTPTKDAPGQKTAKYAATLIQKTTNSKLAKVLHPGQDQRVNAPIVSSIPSAIPKDTARIFTSILFVNNNHDMANREMMVRDDKGNRYHLKIANNQLLALEVNGVNIPENERIEYSELLPQIDRSIAEKSRAKQETIAEFKAKSIEDRRQQLSQLIQSKQAKANNLQKKLPPLPDISNDQERVRGIIATLVQENVVTDPATVDWFGLSDDELVVNGNRQPDALHKKLKAAYGIKPQYGLYYGPVKMVGTGVFLDKGDL